VVRGQGFAVRALLADDGGAPVAGQAVAVSWRGERALVAVTDDAGAIDARVQTNATETPALAAVAVEYLPQPTSVYEPSAASADVRVVQGVALELGSASVERGPIAIAGRLLDDEGRPLAAAAVNVSMDGAPMGEARTARNGTFEL